jgi:hypothetical protein
MKNEELEEAGKVKVRRAERTLCQILAMRLAGNEVLCKILMFVLQRVVETSRVCFGLCREIAGVQARKGIAVDVFRALGSS